MAMAVAAVLTPSCFSSPSSSSSSSSSTRYSISILPSHSISTSFFSSSLRLSSSTFTRRRQHNTNGSSPRATATSEKKKVLIINTDGGAHAAIGFYFAKELLGKGHLVTIFTVGDETSSNMKKPPFSRFSEIVDVGGKTVWGDPGDVAKVFGGEGFDVVLENNAKDLDTVRPVVDWAKRSGATQFLYISSAGIYKPTDEPPHIEGDPVKSDASHVGAEEYVSKVFGSWAIFRPQYVIGSAKHKDCQEWFFDRIVRGRPVPIPGSGIELTNLAHLRDLSSMLTLAVKNPAAASGNIFNCVSDRAVTLDRMARLCAQAAGLPLKIVHYDPTAVGVDAKKAFPFRRMDPITSDELLGLLLREEEHINASLVPATDSPPSVNVASRGGRSSQASGRGDQPSNESSRPRPQFHICTRTSHEAISCWQYLNTGDFPPTNTNTSRRGGREGSRRGDGWPSSGRGSS